jgi:hypothetical protein
MATTTITSSSSRCRQMILRPQQPKLSLFPEFLKVVNAKPM